MELVETPKEEQEQVDPNGFNPFNTEGFTKESLQVIYEVTLEQKLTYEEKLKLIESNLAIAITAIDDGVITELSQVKTGLANLFFFVKEVQKLKELIGDEESRKVMRLDEVVIKNMRLKEIEALVKKKKQEERKHRHK